MSAYPPPPTHPRDRSSPIPGTGTSQAAPELHQTTSTFDAKSLTTEEMVRAEPMAVLHDDAHARGQVMETPVTPDSEDYSSRPVYDGSRRRRSESLPAASDSEWTKHQQTIKRLYLDERMTLRRMMETMRRDYGFNATWVAFPGRLENMMTIFLDDAYTDRLI